MAKANRSPSPYTMAPPHLPQQQDSRYSMMTPSGPQTHSSMPPPPSPNYQPSQYTLPTHLNQAASQGQVPAVAQTPADPLEQRVLDLLYPYRDECFADDGGTTVGEERMALILCGMFPAHARLLFTHAQLC
jgi:hypothetical protein